MKPAEVVMPAERADFGRRTGAMGLEPPFPERRGMTSRLDIAMMTSYLVMSSELVY
jgi:hypothetical protein